MRERRFSVQMACNAAGICRSTFYYEPKKRSYEEALIEELHRDAEEHPRSGYKPTTARLKGKGWRINRKRVQRLRRLEGLKVPVKQQKRRRSGSSTVPRQKALYPNHVWSWDFIFDRTEDGRSIKILNIVDEFSRFSVLLEARRHFRAKDVRLALGRAMVHYGIPGCIRSDNGSEFVATAMKRWLTENGIGITYIDPGSPWQNPYVESLNARLRDECLNRELFTSLLEAQVVLSDWQQYYNRQRPHGALKFRTPSDVYGTSVPQGDSRLLELDLPSEYSSFQLFEYWG